MSATAGNSLMMVCAHCGQKLRLPEDRLVDEPRCPQCKSPVFSRSPIALDDASFGDFVGGTDLPVLVDFWATWCGPCRSMAPVIDRAAQEWVPHVVVAKVDVDASPGTATSFGIRSIPTILLMHRGSEMGRRAGAVPFDALAAWLGKFGLLSPAARGRTVG